MQMSMIMIDFVSIFQKDKVQSIQFTICKVLLYIKTVVTVIEHIHQSSSSGVVLKSLDWKL